MRYPQTTPWWAPWRRRTSAWGAALVDEQQLVLAALTLQASGSVRVAALERPQATAATATTDHPQAFAEHLRAAGALVPRRRPPLALALPAGRCREGVLEVVAGLSTRQLAAEVQLEAAGALAVAPEDVGFDFEVADREATPPRVHWAACSREDLRHWSEQARRAGWRLRGVEPEAQAALRAANHFAGEPMALWAQSPQDWQFGRTPARSLSEAEWLSLRERLQTSPPWGPLVACGVALGSMA